MYRPRSAARAGRKVSSEAWVAPYSIMTSIDSHNNGIYDVTMAPILMVYGVFETRQAHI